MAPGELDLGLEGGEHCEDLVFRDIRRGIYKRLVIKNGRIFTQDEILAPARSVSLSLGTTRL